MTKAYCDKCQCATAIVEHEETLLLACGHIAIYDDDSGIWIVI